MALSATVQTAIGFGAMLICLTVSALVWPVSETLVLVLPIVTVQSGIVVARHHRDVLVDLVVRRVFPLMGLGLVTSLVVVGSQEPPWAKNALGALVLLLAGRELWRARRPTAGGELPAAASSIALVAAGLVHGVFATGGPLLVWALGREPIPKATLRTTLTAIFLSLNTVLVGVFVARGQLTAQTATTSALLLVPMGLGIALGEILHHRVDEGRFRVGVWVALACTALPLLAAQ